MDDEKILTSENSPELKAENILRFHDQLDKATGIRYRGLIESAVNVSFQTFGGQFLCPAVEERAADCFTAWSKITASSTATSASPSQ